MLYDGQGLMFGGESIEVNSIVGTDVGHNFIKRQSYIFEWDTYI